MNAPAPGPRGVLLSIAYDGTPFSGFAPQPGVRTVAGELLGAVRAVDPRVVEVRGASRTDAGVHARDQRVAFDTDRALPESAWLTKLNRHLPVEIAARGMRDVSPGYVPRFRAKGKTYRYLVLCDGVRDPLWESRAWRLGRLEPGRLVDVGQETLRAAIGTHDFGGFRAARDARIETVRTIDAVVVNRLADDPRLVAIDVSGSGFLYNMVRILVGSAVDAARGRAPIDVVARTIASKNRRDAGITAPPHGLYLERVVLDDDAGISSQEDSGPSSASDERDEAHD